MTGWVTSSNYNSAYLYDIAVRASLGVGWAHLDLAATCEVVVDRQPNAGSASWGSCTLACPSCHLSNAADPPAPKLRAASLWAATSIVFEPTSCRNVPILSLQVMIMTSPISSTTGSMGYSYNPVGYTGRLVRAT